MVKTLIKRYLSPHTILIITSLISAAVTVVCSLYLPILIGNSIDTAVGIGDVNFEQLYVVLKKIAVIVVFTVAAQWLMNVCNNRIAYNIVYKIRTDAFTKLSRLSINYFDSHNAGDIMSRVINDVEVFSDGLLMGFSQFFTGIFTIIGTLIFMLTANIGMSLVVIVITPISLIAASFIAKKTYSMFRLQSQIKGEMTGFTDENVGGFKTIKAFGKEEDVLERFAEINDKFQKASLSAIFFSSITNPVTRFVNGLVFAGVAVVGGVLAVKGTITPGLIAGFLLYAGQYTKPFNEISAVLTEFQNAIACADRIARFLNDEEETSAATDTLSDIKGNVSFEDISFSYKPDAPLISGLNLEVKANQRVAIVGPTGCGKTTLINLLMRFYDVTGGSILIDKKAVTDVTRESLRQNFGMVLQETWLKSATIRENISYGNKNASEEDIIRAAKLSHAHNFIERLKDGYNTVISEDGENLSAGEKQLLCIARVMLSLPPMLILDEATSSIDVRTEQLVQQAFLKMAKGRTCFIVAHRLSTIKGADMIIVMDKGHVIECGKHGELLAAKGFYANLYAAGQI